jgi:two-component system cell cycle response regulator DivK
MRRPATLLSAILTSSSFAMKGDEERARAAGCDHYIIKPYSPLQLLRVVREYLGANVGLD